MIIVHNINALAVFIVAVAVYFLPAIIATVRKTHNRNGILLLNVLIGWTGIGWIAALVMACGSVSTGK